MPGRKRMTVLIVISFAITLALLLGLDSAAGGLPGQAGASAAIVLFILIFGVLGAAAEKYHLV